MLNAIDDDKHAVQHVMYIDEAVFHMNGHTCRI